MIDSNDDDELIGEEFDETDNSNKEGNSESLEDMQGSFVASNPQREEPGNPEHTPDNDENPDNSLEEERNPTILRNELPSRKSQIEYKVKKEDSWQEAVVLEKQMEETSFG